VPRPRRICSNAWSGAIAAAYERSLTIASYASQAKMTREPSGIASPASPSG